MFLSDCQVKDCRGFWRIPHEKIIKSAETLRNISGYEAGGLDCTHEKKVLMADRYLVTSGRHQGTTYLIPTRLKGKSGTSFFYHS